MSRVLVLSPHPDDETFGCGGTLRRQVEQGDTVRVVFLTSGEKGGHGRSEAETIVLREEEARLAADILGLSQLEFWHEPDGALRVTAAAVKRMRAVLQTFRPDTIYVPHGREMHPDHRAASRLLRAALAGARGQRPDVLQFEIWTPLQRLDEIIDVSEQMERKVRAMRAYRSQCAVVGFVEALRGLNRYRGEMHSWPGGNYAEAFTRLRA